MKYFRMCFCIALTCVWACDNDSDMPEMGCEHHPAYTIGHKAVYASKVFDVRTDPPTGIENGLIEHVLSQRFLANINTTPSPYPYKEFFFDSVVFTGLSLAEVYYSRDSTRLYNYTRDDCSIFMISPFDSLHIELTHSGNEMIEERYAIYDHRIVGPALDDFLFLEFRDGAFKSEEEIIKAFALDHPGMYDTLAIERVENSTRE